MGEPDPEARSPQRRPYRRVVRAVVQPQLTEQEGALPWSSPRRGVPVSQDINDAPRAYRVAKQRRIWVLRG